MWPFTKDDADYTLHDNTIELATKINNKYFIIDDINRELQN